MRYLCDALLCRELEGEEGRKTEKKERKRRRKRAKRTYMKYYPHPQTTHLYELRVEIESNGIVGKVKEEIFKNVEFDEFWTSQLAEVQR